MLREYLDVLHNKNVVFYLIYDILVVFALAYIKTFYLVLFTYEVCGSWCVAIYAIVAKITSFLSPLIGGFISDLYGRKVAVIISLITTAISLQLIGLLYTSELIIVLVTVLQLSLAIGGPAEVALLLESVPSKYSGRALSLKMFVENALALLSYATLAHLHLALGDRVAFIITSLIVLLSLIPITFIYETYKPLADTPLLLSKMVPKPPPISHYMLIFILFIVSSAFISSLATPYVAPFLKDVHGLSTEDVALAYIVSGVAAIAGAMIAGPVVDRIGSINSLLITSILAIPLLMAFALAPIPISIAALAALAFLEPLNLARNKYIVENTDIKYRGRILGIINAIAVLASLPAPLIAAWLWEKSPVSVYIVTTALIPIEIIPLLILTYTQKRSKKPEI